MDIGRVFARSLEIAWRYKLLWVFGFVMALTGGGGGNNFNYGLNQSNFNRPIAPLTRPLVPPQVGAGVVIVLIAFVACLFILYLILALYFRFVARGALVTSVRNIEKGITPTLGAAWREGHRYYGRLLGLGFLFLIPILIFTLLVLLIAFLPFIGSIVAIANQAGRGQLTPNEIAPIISGFLGFLALACCAIICILIVHLIIHPIYEFAVRGIVLEELGTFEGLARGYRRVRENLGAVALLYLVLIGARIGWSIVLAVFSLPIIFLLLAFTTAIGTTPSVEVIVLVALAIALPIGLIFVFLEGLFQVFESNAWTEGYLALLAMPSAPPPLAPTQ
jgi:hypothetical protein